jgi:hypothetical protein
MCIGNQEYYLGRNLTNLSKFLCIYRKKHKNLSLKQCLAFGFGELGRNRDHLHN